MKLHTQRLQTLDEIRASLAGASSRKGRIARRAGAARAAIGVISRQRQAFNNRSQIPRG